MSMSRQHVLPLCKVFVVLVYPLTSERPLRRGRDASLGFVVLVDKSGAPPRTHGTLVTLIETRLGDAVGSVVPPVAGRQAVDDEAAARMRARAPAPFAPQTPASSLGGRARGGGGAQSALHCGDDGRGPRPHVRRSFLVRLALVLVAVLALGPAVVVVARRGQLVGAVPCPPPLVWGVVVLAAVLLVPGRQGLAPEGEVVVLDGDDHHVLLVGGGGCC